MAAGVSLLGFTMALSDDTVRQVNRAYATAYAEQVRAFAERRQGRGVRAQARELRRHGPDRPAGRPSADAHPAAGGPDQDRGGRAEVRRERRRAAPRRGRAGRRRTPPSRTTWTPSPPTSASRACPTSVKDIVGRSGFGIGSAGLPAYSLLIEGRTEALQDDVVLSMKQGNVAAASRVVTDEAITEAFEHHGHRTVVSQRALQAHADPWLGWCELNGKGFVVSEVSPVRGGPGLGPGRLAGRDRAAGPLAGPGDRQGPLRARRQLRPDARGLRRRGGDHGGRGRPGRRSSPTTWPTSVPPTPSWCAGTTAGSSTPSATAPSAACRWTDRCAWPSTWPTRAWPRGARPSG